MLLNLSLDNSVIRFVIVFCHHINRSKTKILSVSMNLAQNHLGSKPNMDFLINANICIWNMVHGNVERIYWMLIFIESTTNHKSVVTGNSIYLRNGNRKIAILVCSSKREKNVLYIFILSQNFVETKTDTMSAN